jgi:hypothetical protein
MVPHMSTNLQLVGAERCIETVFPDPSSRPSSRTWQDWKAKGYFRWHKIGHRVFYNPDEVAADLTSRFRVDPPDSLEGKGGMAK